MTIPRKPELEDQIYIAETEWRNTGSRQKKVTTLNQSILYSALLEEPQNNSI